MPDSFAELGQNEIELGADEAESGRVLDRRNKVALGQNEVELGAEIAELGRVIPDIVIATTGAGRGCLPGECSGHNNRHPDTRDQGCCRRARAVSQATFPGTTGATVTGGQGLIDRGRVQPGYCSGRAHRSCSPAGDTVSRTRFQGSVQ